MIYPLCYNFRFPSLFPIFCQKSYIFRNSILRGSTKYKKYLYVVVLLAILRPFPFEANTTRDPILNQDCSSYILCKE